MSLSQFLGCAKKDTVDLRNLRNINGIINESTDTDPVLELPLEVKESNWNTLQGPERLRRTFKFETMKEVLYFFNEVYKFQFKINHHCKILIDSLNVTIETYTHTVDSVTEQDIKIKKHADNIFEDLKYFKS